MSDPLSIIAGPIIQKLIDEVCVWGDNKYSEIFGVKEEIEKLVSNLSAIQAAVSEAEQCLLESKNSLLVDWLTKLKDAALDVEDLLETCATKAAIRSLQKHPSPFSWLAFQLDASSKIKKVVAKINEISEERTKFHFKKGDYGGEDWTPIDRSALRETNSRWNTSMSDIVGREEEKDDIVKWLLSEEDYDADSRFPVLAIVGMGGLGKTTLAQLVYNDERLHRKNDETSAYKVLMWVNVSMDSSVDGILRMMVEILTERKQDTISDTAAFGRILEVLDGRRFLLVLDDVWPDKFNWEPLHNFLKKCPRGSKVLVTSRNRDVERVMGTSRMKELDFLPEDKCWDMFRKRAFRGTEYPIELEAIGKQIIHKCAYLPLAIKAMAGLLDGNTNENRWLRILKNGVWVESTQPNISNGTGDILPALKLSYDYLPSQLKQCFVYCYIFPKGQMLDKYDLIKLWIAQGYIKPRGEDKLEVAGCDYFDELLSRSFFQILNIDDKERYKMHDFIHDLAKSVSSCCQQVEENKKGSVRQNTRHVSFLCQDIKEPASEILKAKKLRTLLLPTVFLRDFSQVLDKMFRTLSCLRVLDLNSSSITDLPKSIGDLTLLRYLDLSRTQINMLPNTICNLYNLQILRLLGCHWLSELPNGLGNLKHLRHLELDEIFWYKCSSLPPRIGGLTNLHDLHSFHVLQESGYGIDELGSMGELEGVLYISNLENSANSEPAKLMQKEGIKKLVLEWSSIDMDTSPQERIVQERVLEDLEPHHALQELQIRHFKGNRFSNWIGNGTLFHLSNISLINCRNCKTLSLGPLPHLRQLIIKGLLELVEWPKTLYPSLGTLKLSRCPMLKEFPHFFPNLRAMTVKQCDALRVLPLMPSLMFMRLIDNLLLEDFHEEFMHIIQTNNEIDVSGTYMSLLELKILNCPRLQDLPEFFFPQKLELSGSASLRSLPIPEHSQRLQCLELGKYNGPTLIEAIPSTSSLYSLIISNHSNLPSIPILPYLPGVKALYLQNCVDLTSLSNGSLHSLVSLKTLSISGCPKLLRFPDADLPTSIEFLSINNCSILQSFHPHSSLTSLTLLKDLYLENCPRLESLPDDGFPTSVKHLCIRGCPLLLLQGSMEIGGRYWPIIQHIADLEIDSVRTLETQESTAPRKCCFGCFQGSSSSSAI